MSKDGLGMLHVEGEMLKEAASALGVAGRRLQEALDRLATLEARRLNTPLSQRDAFQAEHRAARQDAARKLYAILVQREAMGLRHHDELYRAYAVPKDLAPSPL